MADTRITQLGEISTVTSDDYFVTVDGTTSTTKKVQAGNMLPDGVVTTAKVADGNITFAKLLSTIFSGQRQTYTNTGDGGGSGYYVNLGGIKLCWGTSVPTSVPSAVTRNISLPSSFFTSIQYSSVTPGAGTAVAYMQIGGAVTTTNLPVYITPTASTGNLSVLWFVIGT